MISNIDENMGLLMEKLEEWGMADNTMLIFMTDNGTSRGHQVFNACMKGNKGSVYEGGTRVPLFVRLPGRTKAGVEIDNLARHYDILPTLAELAGAELPKNIDFDGRSLLPLIDNPEAEWSDRYTFFHKGRWNKAGVAGRWGEVNTNADSAKYIQFAVRNEQWRLVGKDELYDINKDPEEQNNVMEDNPEVVAKHS